MSETIPIFENENEPVCLICLSHYQATTEKEAEQKQPSPASEGQPKNDVIQSDISSLQKNYNESSESSQTSTNFVHNLRRSPRKFTSSSLSIHKETYQNYEIVAHLPCKHFYHNTCILEWVETATTCPTCRRPFDMVHLSETPEKAPFTSFRVEQRKQVAAEEEEEEEEENGDFDGPYDWLVSGDTCFICHCEIETTDKTCAACQRSFHQSCLSGRSDFNWEVDGDFLDSGLWACKPCMQTMSRRLSRSVNRDGARRTGRSRNGQSTEITALDRIVNQISTRRQQESAWKRAWERAKDRAWENLNRDLDVIGDLADIEEEALSSREILRREKERRHWLSRMTNGRFKRPAMISVENEALLEQNAPPKSDQERQEDACWEMFNLAKEEVQPKKEKGIKEHSKLDKPSKQINGSYTQNTAGHETPDMLKTPTERKLKRPSTRDTPLNMPSSSKSPSLVSSESPSLSKKSKYSHVNPEY